MTTWRSRPAKARDGLGGEWCLEQVVEQSWWVLLVGAVAGAARGRGWMDDDLERALSGLGRAHASHRLR